MEESVKVFSKISALLDVLASVDDATPAELAERLSEPRSSLYRLLSTLERHDFVQPGLRKGSYQLGMRLFHLGSAVSARFDDIRSAATTAMEELHDQTRQTVFLTIRRGFDATCIERIDGEVVQVMILRVGGSVPLHGGAGARVLLAYQPTQFWTEFVSQGELHRYTATTPVTKDALFTELRTILHQGYSVSNEDVIPGITSVGAPIFNYSEKICASISVSGPRPSVGDDALAQTVSLTVAAAEEISRRLGAPTEIAAAGTESAR
ncbi:IclR family transcriptional regulator [Mycobacterium aquaticum]|uniref:IclR family transcriptional regulator n=1 Tax=Mycobacterium aquaticum TaxID=1927124 RepID=A0A1X0BAN4_9MYCO|nr:IclR family transcriptional regulator [Mycobacterium aquaticum]ORA39245.1 hypothetical protein BST13_02990 [Mycobacterium aquaticum]